jgi:TM2 domain-containing membrane protein YozV
MSDEKSLEDNLKDKAKEFTEEAKESASEFTENAKETFTDSNKKIIAGVLAILLGGLGIHKFVLGYTKEGIIILVITCILGVLTCGFAGWLMCVLGLIEGIVYLTKSDEEFYNTYQVGKKPWF